MTTRPNELRAEIPATLQAIEDLCHRFRLWHVMACAPMDAFAAELLLREALTNSVLHGCAGDPSRFVECILRLKRGRLLIVVRDGGSGFDWRASWDAKADLFVTHGRGVEIYRRYATSVRFNPEGNAVALIKRF